MKSRIFTLQTSRVFHLMSLIAVLLATAASGEQRAPYTESELETALPMGIPGVRTWADAPLSKLSAQVHDLPSFGSGRATFILALSGGGEHGAFGAGLLNGWSESGRRPAFDIVTDVSTGGVGQCRWCIRPDFYRRRISWPLVQGNARGRRDRISTIRSASQIARCRVSHQLLTDRTYSRTTMIEHIRKLPRG